MTDISGDGLIAEYKKVGGERSELVAIHLGHAIDMQALVNQIEIEQSVSIHSWEKRNVGGHSFIVLHMPWSVISDYAQRHRRAHVRAFELNELWVEEHRDLLEPEQKEVTHKRTGLRQFPAHRHSCQVGQTSSGDPAYVLSQQDPGPDRAATRDPRFGDLQVML